MTGADYKKQIIEIIKKVEDVSFLRRIYLILVSNRKADQ